MTSKPQKGAATKFYQEDIVQRLSDPTTYGVVLRCWHDSDDIPAAEAPADPLLRSLKRGEVGVSFYPNHSRDILPESDFILVDRPMQVGDIVKRRIEDMQSAVVTSVDVEFKLAHAVSGHKLDEWKTFSDIKDLDDIAIGDYVAYNDWIGQVQEMFDEATVETADGSLVRIPEISAHLGVGERGADILPNPPGEGLSGLLAYFMGDVRPSASDTVVSIKHTVLAIAWMAINQLLTPEEAAMRQRPQRFWSETDISELTLIRGLSDQAPRIGDRLTLKNPPQHMLSRHGRVGDRAGILVVDSFVVCGTRTKVTVLWQDGKQDTLPSTELIPYLNPDEYDCWPGDHVEWKNEDEKHGAVVQSVNALERTAEVILYSGRRELVSVLELDPHGADANMSNPQEAFGLRRGDLVFIHPEGRTNGCQKPMVPSIGELEAWAHESPYVEPEGGGYSGWRKELDDIGQRIARTRGSEPISDGVLRRPPIRSGEINWFGEVISLRTDGMVEVALPDFNSVTVPLERLTRLNDGLEQLEDLWGDELSDGHSDGYLEGISNQPLEILAEDGQWHTYDGEDEDDWVEDGEDGPMDEDEDIDMHGDAMSTDEATADVSLTASEGVVPGAWPNGNSEDEIAPQASSTPKSELYNLGPSSGSTNTRTNCTDSLSEPTWKRFDILPSAPADHAFMSTPPPQTSRQFLARLSREYRALSSSLPESIIVRTYEDRTDLLRSLIIGPENTPYEDAPFVIDWMLDANFPQTPPIAHFLSWTNGNGRVNPNLYEEGKVCLSILGTWAGDRSESWSPARSSLLQALVSIQGLVLVKEPWFCEPSYEKWRGTDEGTVNSRLYSEKAYVLSRGFVRRALEIPLGGLEDVIRDIYQTRGKLAKVIRVAQNLIEKSKASKEIDGDSDLAVPRLTGGGVITLTRTLDKLEGILASQGPTMT